MKNFLVFLGVSVVLLFTVYFPFGIVYDAAFNLWGWGHDLHDQVFLNAARLRLTLASCAVAAVLVLIMWLLRKATRHFNLVLFEHVLTAGMYYVSIMTALMLTGMWLDFEFVYYGPLQGGFKRIGFVFYEFYL